MLRNLFILTSVVFAFGSVNISAQSTNEPVIVSKGVVNGSAVSMPKPVYPASAIAVQAGGAVNVEVLVDENGDVIEANAVSGHPLLRSSAVTAARGAKFKPMFINGKTVRVKGVIVYNFALPKIVPENVSGASETNSTANSPALRIQPKGVVNGKAISLPKPPYPAEAKKDRFKSLVNVQVTIDEEGNVISAKAVSGNPVFHPSAEKAALGAKFSPTLMEGNPVKVTGVIVYNFVP